MQYLAAAAPTMPDGKPDLSGVWLRIRPATIPTGQSNQNLRYLLRDGEVVPYQAWAEALYLDRIAHNSGGAPHERCLPSGIPGNMLPPRLFKIVQTPRVTLVLYEESSGTRQIHTDGRTHPVDPNPSWWTFHGHWDGDTFVVETMGFNDKSWLDKSGHPRTEALRTIERFRRIDFGRMDVEVTIDGPKAYTKPWKVTLPLALQADTELIEDECENERDAVRIQSIMNREKK